MKHFCTGEAWEECWRNVWIFWSGSGKIMKDSSQGAENHTEMWPPTVSEGPRGGRRCQSDWGSARRKTWGKLRLVDSGPFAGIRFKRRRVACSLCYDTKVAVKVTPRKNIIQPCYFRRKRTRRLPPWNWIIIQKYVLYVKETVSGARFGHERSSEPRSFFVIASREFMSFHSGRQMRRAVHLSFKTHDE